MWVVKLGGSLARAQQLRRWLQALVRYGGGRTVVVPGGGPFADQVRNSQAFWRFDDGKAHDMASLAMDQYGLMLSGLERNLVVAVSVHEIRDALLKSKVPVWMPSQMVRNEPALPRSWCVTSDSLAAWLANRCGADGLLLVKSAVLNEATIHVAQLQQRGLVDAAVPSFIRAAKLPVTVVGRDDHISLEALLHGRSDEIGTRVITERIERTRSKTTALT